MGVTTLYVTPSSRNRATMADSAQPPCLRAARTVAPLAWLVGLSCGMQHLQRTLGNLLPVKANGQLLGALC